MAMAVVEMIVPMCAMLRRSLSSEAAASLASAFTRAVAATERRVPSNQTVACGAPPFSFSISRMMRADAMSCPMAALATVLAMLIAARSSVTGGRSSTLVLVRNSASSPAMVIGSAFCRLIEGMKHVSGDVSCDVPCDVLCDVPYEYAA